MGEMKLIAVPTAFSIYRVKDDVIQMHKAEFMTFPMSLVMDMLALRGLAKLVAKSIPYDLETDLDDNEEIDVPDAYRMGDTDESPTPDNPGVEELPGPWYTKQVEENDD